MIRRPLVALLAVAGAACGSGAMREPQSVVARQATPPGLAGCYALFDRAGHPAAQTLYWAPSFTRLDTAGHLAWKLDATGARQAPGDTVMESRVWVVDSLADTVRITFHSGFSGTTFVLGFERGRDTLNGRAISHGDVGPVFEHDAGRAYATRVACVP